MGKNISKMTDQGQKREDYQDESQDFENFRNFCGYPCQFFRTNFGKQYENWEEVGLFFCSEYKEQAFWTSEITHLLQVYLSSDLYIVTRKFRKQFDNIRESKRTQQLHQVQTQMTVLDRSFRQNMQKSILLHPNQLNKVDKRQRNTIQSNMDFTFAPERRYSSKSIFNSEVCHNPAKGKGQDMKNKSSNRNSLSLPNERISFIFKQKQQVISKQNAMSLKYFIEYSTTLQKHLTNNSHQIFKLIQKFQSLLYNTYSDTDKLTEMEMKQFIKNILIFIFFLVEAVRAYYFIEDLHKKEQQGVCLIAIHDNLFTLITTILFKDETLYNFVFEIIKKYKKQKDQVYSKKYRQLSHRFPEHFSVSKQYWINQQSFKQNQQIKISRRQYKKTKFDVPYEQCSQILLKINDAKTPISKMKLILQCAESITQCIAQFYKNNKIQLKNNQLDADQILSIFCYILNIKEIQNINSNLFFIESFATQNQKISVTGYYFSVLSCAVDNLINQKKCGKDNQPKMNQVLLFKPSTEETQDKKDFSYSSDGVFPSAFQET